MERNTEKLSVVYVKSLSPQGESLRKQVVELFDDFSLRQMKKTGVKFEIEMMDVVNEFLERAEPAKVLDCQEMSMKACMYADVVIFDGSIENGNYDQYLFAYDLMKHLDHVLIVSRTDLPYNFEGRRKGGAPSWIKIGEGLSEFEVTDDPVRLNRYILNWLNDTLYQLELPRSNKLTGQLDLENLWSEVSQAIEKSNERVSDLDRSALFISYLSRDYGILKSCFTQIESHTGVSKEHFHYFAPGKVAEEFMTERRRWEIVSVTDREMAQCGSLLFFETEGYDQSWWTMGERMSVSYKFRDNWKDCPAVYVVRVRVNSEGTPEFTWKVLETSEQKKEFFPRISDRQYRRLARRFANSDPGEAAYELDEKSERESQRSVPTKAMLAVLKGTAISLAGRNEMFKDILENNTLMDNISYAWESVNSYTHTEAFRKLRIVECQYCRKTAPALTMDNFIQLDMPYVYRVNDEDVVERDDGTLTLLQKCPIHGSIRLKKNGHYYRFVQPRRGLIMGKGLIEYVDRIDVCGSQDERGENR